MQTEYDTFCKIESLLTRSVSYLFCMKSVMGAKKPTSEDCMELDVRFWVPTDVLLRICLLGCDATLTGTQMLIFQTDVVALYSLPLLGQRRRHFDLHDTGNHSAIKAA